MNKNIEYFAIVALDLNQGIGYKDQILFHNKMDLNIFKEYSICIQNCIVGRVTYNTLPKILGKTRKFHIVTRTEQVFDNDSVCITDKFNLDQNKYVIVGGNEIYKTGNEVYMHGLQCKYCSDGFSYAEKFMKSILSQLGIFIFLF